MADSQLRGCMDSYVVQRNCAKRIRGHTRLTNHVSAYFRNEHVIGEGKTVHAAPLPGLVRAGLCPDRTERHTHMKHGPLTTSGFLHKRTSESLPCSPKSASRFSANTAIASSRSNVLQEPSESESMAESSLPLGFLGGTSKEEPISAPSRMTSQTAGSSTQGATATMFLSSSARCSNESGWAPKLRSQFIQVYVVRISTGVPRLTHVSTGEDMHCCNVSEQPTFNTAVRLRVADDGSR